MNCLIKLVLTTSQLKIMHERFSFTDCTNNARWTHEPRFMDPFSFHPQCVTLEIDGFQFISIFKNRSFNCTMYTHNGTFKIHPPSGRNWNSSYSTWIHPHKNSIDNCYSIQDEHMNLMTRRVTQYTQQQDYQLPHDQDCKWSMVIQEKWEQ